MAHDGRRGANTTHIVSAVITHVSGRVLAIQRFGGDAWLLPGGPVASGTAAEVRLRHYVRNATGFEIRRLSVVGVYPIDDRSTEFVRCEISGVGSDITSHTRMMRWLDRAAIVAHMAPVDARAMLAALDADRRTARRSGHMDGRHVDPVTV